MAERQEGIVMKFCPYCFMEQFEVDEDATEGSVYCEMCGIDVPVKELEKL
jgi:hypothetical protein